MAKPGLSLGLSVSSMKNKFFNNITYFLNDILVSEKNHNFNQLRFLYTNSLGIIIRLFLRSKLIARGMGWYNNSTWSAKKIEPFIRQHAIDMNEFVVPHGGFKTFNDFFIRTLKNGARHIDRQSNTAISPADSKVYVIPNITDEPFFFVKNIRFDLTTFLGSHNFADQFEHGTMYIFRLAPYDYHRFHFPIDCTPSKPHIINGTLESVNPISFYTGNQPLLSNERQLFLLNSTPYTTVAMVAVGAMMVGKIIPTYQAEQSYKKGDEAGYFAFGGSTVVLLFQKDTIAPSSLLIDRSKKGFETALKMGQFLE